LPEKKGAPTTARTTRMAKRKLKKRKAKEKVGDVCLGAGSQKGILGWERMKETIVERKETVIERQRPDRGEGGGGDWGVRFGKNYIVNCQGEDLRGTRKKTLERKYSREKRTGEEKAVLVSVAFFNRPKDRTEGSPSGKGEKTPRSREDTSQDKAVRL